MVGLEVWPVGGTGSVVVIGHRFGLETEPWVELLIELQVVVLSGPVVEFQP